MSRTGQARGGPEVSTVVATLIAQGATVGTAESLTGGQVAVAFTSVPGASQTFLGAVVSYATDVKIDVLGVPADLVAAHGVVSAECAMAMAVGVRKLLDVTYGVSTTGVAGPAVQEGKPVGTVFVAVAGPHSVEVAALDLPGGRAEIQSTTVAEALCLLNGILHGEEPRVR